MNDRKIASTVTGSKSFVFLSDGTAVDLLNLHEQIADLSANQVAELHIAMEADLETVNRHIDEYDGGNTVRGTEWRQKAGNFQLKLQRNINRVRARLKELFDKPSEQAPVVESTEAVTDASLMVFRGTKIRMRGEQGAEQMCLTDMWKATGSDPSKQPAEWLRSSQCVALRDFLADSQGLGISQDLVSSEKGNPRTGDGGSTWAHWQLAFAYAKYLSPAFHAWVNRAAREKMEARPHGGSAPAAPAVADQLGAFRLLGWKTEQHDAAIAELAGRLAPIESEVGQVKAEVDEVRTLVDELATRQVGPAAPPLRKGWKFCKAYAREVGLPTLGDMSKFVNDLVGIVRGFERGHAANADMGLGDGIAALSISPHLQNELAPLANIATAAIREWGWRVSSAGSAEWLNGKPKRSLAWVKKRIILPKVAAYLSGESHHQQVFPLHG